MLGLKLNHVSKSSPWRWSIMVGIDWWPVHIRPVMSYFSRPELYPQDQYYWLHEYVTMSRRYFRHCRTLFNPCDSENRTRTRWITLLLMPWLPPSPGHRQPWYWLCQTNWSLSPKRNNFKCLHYLILEKWSKMQIHFHIFSKKKNGLKFSVS